MLATHELYNITNIWKYLRSRNQGQVFFGCDTLDNKVIITGGSHDINLLVGISDTVLYNAIDNSWTSCANMNSGRYNHTQTILKNGDILVIGGIKDTDAINSCELLSASN